MRIQILLAALLFLGSLGILAYSYVTTISLPQREIQARALLQSASEEMAQAAAPLAGELRAAHGSARTSLNERLQAIAANSLTEPGMEGGFYIAREERFVGRTLIPLGEEADLGNGDVPSPLEFPFIRRQAEESLDTGLPRMRTEDIGPSRVVIVTQPAGGKWPADICTWLLFRLTGPELLQKQLRRSEYAAELALGGVMLSLFMTWRLGSRLRKQRLEEEKLRENLRRAEHLASLGKLLAGVAHEVRNPLAAIRSTVQLWQRMPDSARTEGSLQAVIQSVDRLNDIVTRLLYFSRADNAERSHVNINSLVSETLELLRAKAEGQSVQLIGKFPDDLPTVPGSPSALRQVVLNLLSNSLQAMPGGGILTCSTAWQAESRHVEVRIADTGPGVSEEAQAHLFEPFFTTRPDGTGLGLALCREIVDNHGGAITLCSSETPGAVFRFVLPADNGRAAPKVQDTATAGKREEIVP